MIERFLDPRHITEEDLRSRPRYFHPEWCAELYERHRLLAMKSDWTIWDRVELEENLRTMLEGRRKKEA